MSDAAMYPHNPQRRVSVEWFEGDVRVLHNLQDLRSLAAGDTYLTAGRVIAVEPEGLVLAGYSAADRVRLRADSAELPSPTETGLMPGDIVAAAVRRVDGELVLITLELLVLSAVQTDPTEASQVSTNQGELRLYSDPDLRRVLESTDLLLSRVRAFLRERGYLELQLPVLNDHADISPNIPFTTRSSTGERFNLRTTFPYFERVFFSVERAFQIGPMFRDELAGADREPEFNMLCLGSALCDYGDMMNLGQELVAHLALEVTGRTTVVSGGSTIRLDQPWRRCPLGELLEEYAGVTIDVADDLLSLWKVVRERGLTSESEPPTSYSQLLHGRLLDDLLKEYVYPRLLEPTFVTEFPYYYGGPARPVPGKERRKMRAEAFVGGVEIAETVGLLTDANSIDRWHATMRREKEVMGWRQPADELFLDTMRRGIFPSAVIAFGIERLLMLLLETGDISSIAVYPSRKSSE